MRNLTAEVARLLASVNATVSLMNLWGDWDAVQIEVLYTPAGSFQVARFPCDRVITPSRCDLVNPDAGHGLPVGLPFATLDALVNWLLLYDAQLNDAVWDHINIGFDDEIERLYDSGR